jgi:hypothetical protein
MAGKSAMDFALDDLDAESRKKLMDGIAQRLKVSACPEETEGEAGAEEDDTDEEYERMLMEMDDE